jgi:transcriptional regulator with XRE-family HTH domain
MSVAGRLIRESRSSAGLTMSELAARAGTSVPTVSRYENGLVDPGSATLDRLLRACGCELSARPVGLPSSIDDVVDRFEGQPAATRDDVTRTSDGGEVRTAADLEAFVDQLRSEGLLTS